MTLGRLSGLDSAFLAAERPGNPLHVMGLLVLDPTTVPGGYRFEAFREFVAQRLPVLAPLRRRLVEVPGGLARPYWIDEPAIDLDLHLRRAAVPSPGGPREVAEMAARMLERPLDRSRPLWEMELVEGLAGGRIALLAKVHHSMMDGLAGMKLMASLFSETPALEAPRGIPRRAPSQVPSRLRLLADAVPWLARQPWRATLASARTARSLLRRALRARGRPAAPALEVARSWLNVQITPQRAVAYTSLALADLRAVGAPLGATVTDVLLALMAGALRRYLAARGVVPSAPLVAAVPIAVRGRARRAGQRRDEHVREPRRRPAGSRRATAPDPRRDGGRQAHARQQRRRGSRRLGQCSAAVRLLAALGSVSRSAPGRAHGSHLQPGGVERPRSAAGRCISRALVSSGSIRSGPSTAASLST